ncbi:hypothetical protein Tco_0474267 [Tanacetum coccineum]
MDSIEQCIVKRASHEQEIQNRLKSGIVSDKGNDQGLENQGNTSRDESSRSRNECNDKSTSKDDTDIKPSYDTKPMAEADQNAEACDDEHVVLANLIANLKHDIDENKKDSKAIKESKCITDSRIERVQIYS